MIIAFIGFGEAARAFQESLAALDPSLSFAAFDILLDDPQSAAAMREAMVSRGVAVAAGCGDLVRADWIVSAVTADQSLAAVRSLLPHLVQGQTIIDINSVSPGTKRESARLVEGAGASYLDMAVMAPVHPRGHRTPILVAGPRAGELAESFAALEMDFDVVGEQAGAATAIKMVRSLFVKGLEAVTVETLLAAKASGCFEEILASLSASFPGLGWPKFAEYEFERTLRHGRRRAAEMRESAATVAALGLHGGLGEAIADIQERMGRAGPQIGDTLEDTVAKSLAARLEQPTS